MMLPQIISDDRLAEIAEDLRRGHFPDLDGRDIWGMINRIENLEDQCEALYQKCREW